MINVDSKLLDALQESSCFGIAFDDTVPECKQCDVKNQCKAKSGGADVPLPTKSKPKKEEAKSTKKPTPKKKDTAPTKKADKPKAKVVKSPKSSPSNPNMPNFKEMSLDELIKLASDRNVDWKDYGNDNITRMRLIMSLKKSY